MKIELELSEEEEADLFIEGVNQVILEQGRDKDVVCVALSDVQDITTAKKHDLTDEEVKGVVLIGIAKRLGFELIEI